MIKRPKSLTCYVCGRDFGTRSLGIHLPQCIKKFQQNEQLKEPKHRRKVPPAPHGLEEVLLKGSQGTLTDDDIRRFNNKQYENFNENVLVPCPHCGRTFLDDRLTIHLRSCKPKAGQSQPKEKKVVPKQNISVGPLTLLCFICHREYGTLSLKVHIPQCMKSQGKQVEMPPQLENLFMKQHLTRQDVEAYNSSVLQHRPRSNKSVTFQDQQPQCPPVAHHSPYHSENIPPSDDEYHSNNPQLVPCSICGRKFAIGRIDMHQKICKRAQEKEKQRVSKYGIKYDKKQQQEEVQRKEKSKAKWRQQHEQLVATMKYMREVKKAEEKGLDIRQVAQPKGMQTQDQSLVECPHCHRRFNQMAANRHIPICKNVINKPAPVSQYNRYAPKDQSQYLKEQYQKQNKEIEGENKKQVNDMNKQQNRLTQRHDIQDRHASHNRGPSQNRQPIQARRTSNQPMAPPPSHSPSSLIHKYKKNTMNHTKQDTMRDLLQQKQFQPQLDRIAHLQKQEKNYKSTIQEQSRLQVEQHLRHQAQQKSVQGYKFMY